MCGGAKTQINYGKFQKSGLTGKINITDHFANYFSFVSREATAAEEEAAKVITSCLRRYAKARLKNSMEPGTPANQDVSTLLTQSVPLLEPHIKKLGTSMLQ